MAWLFQTAAEEKVVADAGTSAGIGAADCEPKEFRYLPSEEDLKAVAELKEGIEQSRSEFPVGYENYQFTDTTVLRFYRGRKHDMEKALHGLLMHVKWRHENGTDAITEDDVREEINKRKIWVKNTDKNGRPIIWIVAARHDSADRDINVMRKFIIWTIRETVKANHIDQDERMVLIFDLSFFGLACMDYEVVKLLVDILQMNFPDILEVAYIVNSPFIFYACWAVIKPWLDPVTVEKVCFCSTEELQSVIGCELIEDFGTEGPLVLEGREWDNADNDNGNDNVNDDGNGNDGDAGRGSVADQLAKLGVDTNGDGHYQGNDSEEEEEEDDDDDADDNDDDRE
jgi:hypothetical protein